MKLTDQIKDMIDKANSEEEVQSILENFKGDVAEAGLILDEEDLNKVAGGLRMHMPSKDPTTSVFHTY